jgi:hypothetical protein
MWQDPAALTTAGLVLGWIALVVAVASLAVLYQARSLS